MKIQEIEETAICTVKSNGVISRHDSKTTVTKAVVLSNRDRKLLQKLSDIKPEICARHDCGRTNCPFDGTVICTYGANPILKKVPATFAISVEDKEPEPPKPAYPIPQTVDVETVDQDIFANLRELKKVCGSYIVCNNSCRMRSLCQCYQRDESQPVRVSTWEGNHHIDDPIVNTQDLIHTVCKEYYNESRLNPCGDCPLRSRSINSQQCKLRGMPSDWSDSDLISVATIIKEELKNYPLTQRKDVRNDTGRKSNN